MVCSAALSIGLSADSRCLVHDNESPVTHPSAAPVIRATAETLSLVFILDGIIPQFSLTPADILKGLSSPAFFASAKALRQKWCERFQLPQDPGVHILQQQPQNRWTVHPAVDGCQPEDRAPPPLH